MVPTDLFDDATHRDLDRAVNEAVKRSLGDASDLISVLHCSALLHAIVTHSNNVLDKKYVDLGHASELLHTHEELGNMLASAWKGKSYREIRNLAILRASTARPAPPRPATENAQDGLLRSFEANYHGAAVEGFYEYLTYNEMLFREPRAQHYAKLCSIVQSSGTGKSRLLTELRKKVVIVIYMNLREQQDVAGFPARDPIPSKLLTHFPSTVDGYQTVCYSFLTALFDTILESLLIHQTPPRVEAVMRWVDQMCDMNPQAEATARTDFFRNLDEKYREIHADLVRYQPRQPSNADEATEAGNGAETDVDETRLSLCVHPVVSSHLSIVLTEAYKRLGDCLTDIFPDGDVLCGPKLVITIDEAHPLCSIHHGYRPADVFYRAVNDYSHAKNYAAWIVFASTTSKVAEFSPPNWNYSSTRIHVQGELLFPPYTQLGWDQNAIPFRGLNAEDVARLDHIIGYGRPLWVSLKIAHEQPYRVLTIASSKLYGPRSHKPDDTSHVLAILGQRFGLNVTLGHPDSIEHLERGVASHLRICLATTADRSWRFTSYPSEPLLSCVAANDLHKGREILGSVLRVLLKLVNSGMIDLGQRGELTSRLLWLLGKDLFIRTKAKNVVTKNPETWDGHLVDCQMVSVVDWLEFMFGPRMWAEGRLVAREAFKDAYLNFSHWVCMDANIAGSKEDNDLDEWTARHWQRTSGVQCCHQQPRIDKVIPIYFKGKPGTTPVELRMSQILISDKARKSKHSKEALHKITLKNKYLGGKNRGQKRDSKSLPYIAILADLGQPPSFSATFAAWDANDRCLRIYAAGVNSAIYPFLADHPELKNTLEDLVHLQQLPEVGRPYAKYLDAQAKFGSTATPEHMDWEHGKAVPTMLQ